MLLSMISSETKKKACRSSVIHPNVAASKYCCSDSGASRIMETESGTDMPRLHFPPIVLALRDFGRGQSTDWKLQGELPTALYHWTNSSGRLYCFA